MTTFEKHAEPQVISSKQAQKQYDVNWEIVKVSSFEFPTFCFGHLPASSRIAHVTDLPDLPVLPAELACTRMVPRRTVVTNPNPALPLQHNDTLAPLSVRRSFGRQGLSFSNSMFAESRIY